MSKETKKSHVFLPKDKLVELVLQYQKERNPNDLVKIVDACQIYIKHFARKFDAHVYDDLVSCGTIAIIKAIDKFDHAKSESFLNYATYWIKAEMHKEFIRMFSTVTISNRSWYLTAEYNKAVQEGKNTLDYIACTSIRGSFADVSLNAPSNTNEDASELAAMLPDDRATPDEELQDSDMHSFLYQELASVKDGDMLIKYYGLNGYRPRILTDIGEEYGISRERVRQRMAIALTKLRTRFNKENLLNKLH